MITKIEEKNFYAMIMFRNLRQGYAKIVRFNKNVNLKIIFL